MDEWTELECGCRYSLVGDTFVFHGCSATCKWVAYVTIETERQGHPLTVLDFTGGPDAS